MFQFQSLNSIFCIPNHKTLIIIDIYFEYIFKFLFENSHLKILLEKAAGFRLKIKIQNLLILKLIENRIKLESQNV